MLSGRYAGRKAVVVKAFDDGNKDRKFGHALVVGIDRAPRKVTKAMGSKKVEKRQRLKPFVKFVNYNHVMPTRYTVAVADAIAKEVSEDGALATDKEVQKQAKLRLKGALQERYKQLGDAKSAGEKDSVGALYFFRKLKF